MATAISKLADKMRQHRITQRLMAKTLGVHYTGVHHQCVNGIQSLRVANQYIAGFNHIGVNVSVNDILGK